MIMEYVRARTQDSLPQNCLLLITVQRSGSTFLMDSLRSHPCIDIESRAILWEKLGLRGNRYPHDLSNGPDATLEIESRPGLGAKIPEFTVEGCETANHILNQAPKYALEKLHPSFYGFDPGNLHSGIQKLSENVCFKIIYLVRDPGSALTSYLNYQLRNPKWVPECEHDGLFNYVIASYEGIWNMYHKIRGKVLDYSDLIDRFDETLTLIYEDLWPNYNGSEAGNLIRSIREKTRRDLRVQKNPSSFFGEQPGPVSGGLRGIHQVMESNIGELKKCYEYYDKLMATRTGAENPQQADGWQDGVV